MLLGEVDARAVGLFNLFVGVLQVVVPTVAAGTGRRRPGEDAGRRRPVPVRLYPYVGLNLLTGADSTGVGYYSLFVAISALGFSCVNFRIVHDRPLGVIWLYWSFLWFLFFLLLGLKRDHLTAYTGWVTAVEGWVTAAIPAFLILADVGDLRERGASGDHAGGLLRLGRRHDGGPAPDPTPPAGGGEPGHRPFPDQVTLELRQRPKIWNTNRPPGVVVSIDSCNDRAQD